MTASAVLLGSLSTLSMPSASYWRQPSPQSRMACVCCLMPNTLPGQPSHTCNISMAPCPAAQPCTGLITGSPFQLTSQNLATSNIVQMHGHDSSCSPAQPAKICMNHGESFVPMIRYCFPFKSGTPSRTGRSYASQLWAEKIQVLVVAPSQH